MTKVSRNTKASSVSAGRGLITEDTSVIAPDMLSALQKAFSDFQLRAEKLSQAYHSMQEEFKKVNLELDRKNNDLARSLSVQEEIRTYLDSILESMDNGVIGIDMNQTVTHFNKAASVITGYDAAGILGKKIDDIACNGVGGNPALIEVIYSGRELRRAEKVLWHRDGHPVPVSYQTALLCDRTGRRIGAVEIFSDISRIKALEEEMQQTRTMAALGEMSATVAHEIRNPLGAMGMWAGLLERDLDIGDPRRVTLGKITEGLSRLNKIVSNLLVYTRPVRAELRDVLLNTIMDEIVSFVEIEIERLGQSIEIVRSYTSKPIVVFADPEKLNQVIMNLCLNAVQAMPDGGVLTVIIDCGVSMDSGYGCFAISDTGSGIEREIISKIFDPFFTTKENGTGLGLAIVKKFVDSHSGYINVLSNRGEGTCMKVFLPLQRD